MQRLLYRSLVAGMLGILLVPPTLGGMDKQAPRRVQIAVVGDILFDRGVREAIDRDGADALFGSVTELLSGADLALANLECPLSRRGLRAAKPFSFRGEPEYARALARAGIDAVTLANNHTLDYGRAALLDTVSALNEHGVVPVGAGATRAEAMRPRIFDRNGVRIAVLGYCDLFIEGTTPRADVPGVATGDQAALLTEIRTARSTSDVVVLLLHWGVEYRAKPTEAQRDFARMAVAAGATMVLGAHPHVLQPIERVGPSLIAYSLGNFVFDQRGDGADSVILFVTVTSTGIERVDTVPIRIDACKPSRAEGADAERVARRLAPL